MYNLIKIDFFLVFRVIGDDAEYGRENEYDGC